ncbi:DUF5047 domain-containing protein [Actinoplanes sp. NPDC049802]|uniref:DUF5047 domain-containing protein n=1 Tax=Actinoplanes sp. NPDC049802 TaxID=3154742 RepID=UPI0033FDFB50
MRPVSDAFLRTLRGSHTAAVQAFVVDAGQTGTAPAGTEIPVIGGDVQLDASADVRATLALDVVGSFPTGSGDLLAPYGNEIFVRRGIAFGGGRIEWVSLGYFRITSVEQDDASGGPIRIAGQDRMGGLVKARLIAPVQFAATDTYGDVVTELVTDVYPGAVIEWDDTTDTDPLARAVIAEEDRHAFLAELVAGRGKIWFWDHRGHLVITDPPDPSDPVWAVDSGEGGVLIDLGREISDEGVYNAVVVTGEAVDTTAPPSAIAYDNDPNSPTYWGGPFGKVPRFYTSSFIVTAGQAQTTANAMLRQTLGLPYNVDFQAIVNPALEPWDPVSVRLAGRTETHVIERLTVPLSPAAAMTGQTREQTLVVIGEADA